VVACSPGWFWEDEEQDQTYDEDEARHDADEREREGGNVEDHAARITSRHRLEQGRI